MEPEKRTAKTSAARLSVISNSSLVLLKLVVGFLTGSVSIMAEAIHSGVDLVAAAIAWFAVHFADQPPDEGHAFGHGKLENVSGTVEALLIVVAAVYIGYEAVLRMIHEAPLERLGIGVAVMGVSTIANWLISARLFRVAEETDSIALQADGYHLRLDVYTSVGVLAGLLAVWLTDIVLIDRIMGLAVAVWIGWIGVQLTCRAFGALLDRRLPPSEEERIVEIIQSEEGVVGFHKLRTRKSGAHRHVDVHLFVPRTMSLYDAHRLAEDVEDRVRAEFPNTSILTHVEPEGDEES